MKKKACKKCKRLVLKEDHCPICKGDNFSTNWKGRLYILDPEKSVIAQKLDIKQKGEYAIKTP